MSGWNKFPYSNSEYRYEGTALSEAWPELHRGDRVPIPGRDWLVDILERFPDAAPPRFDGDIESLGASMQNAWRHFHAGDFEASVELSRTCGVLAHASSGKAAGVYATYLEKDEGRQQTLFLEAARRSERAMTMLPDDPNTYYFHAFNLGRYSQSISIVEALRQGIGGRIHNSLKRTLELEPDHAEAHTAMGLYHAEIIDKVGKMIGGMTYGASTDKALEHFQRALELTPDAPIANIEYGNGLYMLFGDRRLEEVTELYIKASEAVPRDAMERLDVESALAELE